MGSRRGLPPKDQLCAISPRKLRQPARSSKLEAQEVILAQPIHGLLGYGSRVVGMPGGSFCRAVLND
jgi:hypothetical protein